MLVRTKKRIDRKPSFSESQRMYNNGHWARLNLAAHWIMNEGGGNRIYDVSGNSNTGNFAAGSAAPTWAEGGKRSALKFDGSNDSIEVADHPTLEISPSVTVSAWINTNTVSGAHDIVGRFRTNGHRIWTLFTAGNDMYFTPGDSSGNYNSAYDTNAGAGSLAVNTWYHFVGTVGGSRIKVFVNGVQKNDKAGPSALYTGSTDPYHIGMRGGGSNYFSGFIDNIRIYSRALSLEEIQALYVDEYPEYTDRLWVGGAAAAGGTLYIDVADCFSNTECLV